MKNDSRWRIARTAGLGRVMALVMLCLVGTAVGQTTHYDFGFAGTESGYVSADSATPYPAGSDYGGLSITGLMSSTWLSSGVTYTTNTAPDQIEATLGSSTTNQVFTRLKVNQ